MWQLVTFKHDFWTTQFVAEIDDDTFIFYLFQRFRRCKVTNVLTKHYVWHFANVSDQIGLPKHLQLLHAIESQQ